MMLAPRAIVLGPGKVRLWWTHFWDWIEWKVSPRVARSRQNMPGREAEVTRLEKIIDDWFP
jgi:hypothetical protein